MLRVYLLGPVNASFALSVAIGGTGRILLLKYCKLVINAVVDIVWDLAVLHRLTNHKVTWSSEQKRSVIRAQSHKQVALK